MNKKKKDIDPLEEAILQINASNPDISLDKKDEEIVDIITFCNNEDYLSLPQNGLRLWVSQRVILKCFYKNTLGNKNIILDGDEWKWLYDNEEDEDLEGYVYEKNIKNVLKKIIQMDKNQSSETAEKKTPKYFSMLHLVLGRRGSKCRYEKDLIPTTEGSLTYRELCDRINLGEKIGICTYHPETLERSVTYDVKAKDNGIVHCYELETKRGLRDISSYNHPYLVWRDQWEKPKFIHLENLQPGDKIAVANKTELFGKGGIGVNKAALLGHFQGDGGTTHFVSYSTASEVMLNDFKDLINKEFNGYVVKHKSNYDYNITKSSGRKSQNGSQKNEIKEWLVELDCFGKKAVNKCVPECILKGNKEEVSAFLSRFFGCDGYACTEKKIYEGHGGVPKSLIGCTLASRELVDGIRHLLLKFGIHATVKEYCAKYKGTYKKNWKLTIVRKKCLEIFEKEINIFSKEDNVRLAVIAAQKRDKSKSDFENIPKGIWKRIIRLKDEQSISNKPLYRFINDRLRPNYSLNQDRLIKYSENIKDEFISGLINSDVKWDIVKSVTDVGNKKTIDLEVNPHHIIGGDIISHNTLMASIITAYEAYKLLVINNGNPHEYYNLPFDDEIAIINVALSQSQAGRLFGQIQARLRNSPFFAGRIAKSTSSEIRLYTNSDLRKKDMKLDIEVTGSVLMLCGHSNPDSLAGYSAILILFDEIAFYDERGKITGTYFFNRLKPSLSKFYKYDAARIVMISSPNNRMGIFYDMFEESAKDDSILSFQLPTWCANEDIDFDNQEMTKDRKNNPEMFAIEYGAQWASGGSYGNYFDPGLIQRCIRGDIGPHTKPQPGFNYYAHVDPANGGNNYSMVMIAAKRYRNNFGEKRWTIYLAGVWIWKPVPGIGLQFHEIDNDVLTICRVFRPLSVTYDDFQSVHSLQFLRRHGVNCRKIQFNRGTKAKIYMNLKVLMEYQPTSELFLYDDGSEASLLITEMENLKFKRISRGVSLLPDKSADVKTDDVIDCLAGACSAVGGGVVVALPEPVTVRTRF
jgi:hypothetical protein